MARKTHPYLVEMGGKIKTLRMEKGLTVRKLSALCGVDSSCLSRIETGQYSSQILTLKAIADALQVSVRDFF